MPKDGEPVSLEANHLLLAVDLDRSSPQPMFRQLYAQLRDAIMAGRLPHGLFLPSSRALARDIGCSRNTVIWAYEQLAAEGYVATAERTRTRVTMKPSSRPPETHAGTASAPRFVPSAMAERLLPWSSLHSQRLSRFGLGYVDTETFPFDVWTRLHNRRWRNPKSALIELKDPRGYPPLREAIAHYLLIMRGLAVSADDILITNGTGQGLDLIFRSLANPGDPIFIENPSYPKVWTAGRASGLELVPVDIDDAGFDITRAHAKRAVARAAVVTPAHSCPLGVRMSPVRRRALLDWATRTGAFIVEDDYNAEFRYAGPPVAPLKASDSADLVFYMGSFSKTIFPNLRLGYLVCPRGARDLLADVRAGLDGYTAAPLQPVVADFIAEGHLLRHVRRVRTRYEAKRAALIGAIGRRGADVFTLQPSDTGLHLCLHIKRARRGTSDVEIAAAAAAEGISVLPLSLFYLAKPSRQGLLVGFSGLHSEEMEKLAMILAAIAGGRAGAAGS